MPGCIIRRCESRPDSIGLDEDKLRVDATILDARAFEQTNIFRLVRDGLAIDQDDMDDVPIVVVGVELPSGPGFVVLARKRIPDGLDEAHGEALMDHACSAFVASAADG